LARFLFPSARFKGGKPLSPDSIREDLDEPLPTEKLADVARISLRQFGRVFKKEIGETPAKVVERFRADAARFRIEGGSEFRAD
jgi:AraC-like DNA-binding protein